MLLLLAPLAIASAPVPAHGFDQLTALAGHWRGTGEGGRTIDIRYRVISNGAALVEEWTSPSGKTTMTVYYRDDAGVLATHFCAQGNQPRLALVPAANDRLHFSFRDASNLLPGASHLSDFWIEVEADGTMRRAETYSEGERQETERMTLRRVAD
jgi:hypothetical protein